MHSIQINIAFSTSSRNPLKKNLTMLEKKKHWPLQGVLASTVSLTIWPKALTQWHEVSSRHCLGTNLPASVQVGILSTLSVTSRLFSLASTASFLTLQDLIAQVPWDTEFGKYLTTVDNNNRNENKVTLWVRGFFINTLKMYLHDSKI